MPKPHSRAPASRAQSLLRRLGAAVARRQPPQAKASAVATLTAATFHGPVWTPADYASLARVGYADNPVVFRCIRLVAEGAAAIPLTLMGDDRRLDAHPLLDLLTRPNPGQSGAELLETVHGHLQTAGNAYLELSRGTSGRPMELHALRPDRMRVEPGPDGWPRAYEYRVGAQTHRFELPPDLSIPPPILHLKSFHPLDDHYGMSPLEAARRAVDLHNAAGAWTKALLDNAARPSGAVIYKGVDGQGHLSEAQHSRLIEELEGMHQGARNAGRPMLLEGGLDWRPMGFSPADMEFLQTKQAAAREIALAFGVPPMLLGLPGDNTYANYQEANRAFARQTLLPLALKTAAALSAWLTPAFPDGGTGSNRRLRLTPDLDAVPALSHERDARWSRIAAADFLSDDEKRRLLGL
ncbi:MAG: phage portal protein [Rhodobacteraceae bacterium]|nr:phage portal protein [Paracoccaceae bacterium]